MATSTYTGSAGEITPRPRTLPIFELTDLGVDERSADLFAQIEIEEKKKLALEIGPQRALLSTLTHEIGEKQRWACKVRYVPPPKEFWSRQFHGFE